MFVADYINKTLSFVSFFLLYSVSVPLVAADPFDYSTPSQKKNAEADPYDFIKRKDLINYFQGLPSSHTSATGAYLGGMVFKIEEGLYEKRIRIRHALLRRSELIRNRNLFNKQLNYSQDARYAALIDQHNALDTQILFIEKIKDGLFSGAIAQKVRTNKRYERAAQMQIPAVLEKIYHYTYLLNTFQNLKKTDFKRCGSSVNKSFSRKTLTMIQAEIKKDVDSLSELLS